MKDYAQGDIVRIEGYRSYFLIVSKNAFIRSTGVFHVCPVPVNVAEGPLHIKVTGISGTGGTAVCEQLKLIDPEVRCCTRIDRLSYSALMDISDAVQGIFEYD